MNEQPHIKSVVTLLSALAQETRLALFRLLIQQGTKGLNAGEIAKRLNVPNSTLSYHLTELEHANLIIAQKSQRQIIYSVNIGQLDYLLSFLIEDCCQSSNESCFTELASSFQKVKT